MRHVSCVLIAITLLINFACCLAQASEEADLAAAKKAFTDGFYSLAQDSLEYYLDNHPDSPRLYEAHALLGRALYYENDFRRASYEFDIVLNAPAHAAAKDAALYWSGDIRFRAGDYKAALEYYQKLLDEYAASKYAPYALYSQAWCYYRLGFLENALSIFDDVVSRYALESVSIDSLFKTAQISCLTADADGACRLINDFIVRYPLSDRTAESYFLLADMDLKQKKYSEALSLFRRSLSISQDAAWADLALLQAARASFGAGNIDEGIRLLEACSRQSQDPAIRGGALLWLAYGYWKKGALQEALKTCDEAINGFPKSDAAAEGYYMKARMLYDALRYREAEETCLKGADKVASARAAKLHYTLAWVYLKLGDTKEALREFRAAAKYSEDAIFAQGALCKAADIYLDGGDIAAAAVDYEAALKKYPDGPYADYAQYRLGLVFMLEKKYSAALLAFQSLLANFPATGLKETASYRLAEAYFKNGMYSKSLAEFEALAKSSPRWRDDADSRYYAANCLYDMNRYEEALEIFKALAKGSPGGRIAEGADYRAAWCYYRLGKDMEAAELFSAFAKKYALSPFRAQAARQGTLIFTKAAENFEKWKMPEDAARLHKKLEDLKTK
jgi:TolA-binding protein